MNITTNSYVPVLGFMALIVIVATSFLSLVHSTITAHAVPDSIVSLDCGGAQVLDPVTMTCGGQ